MTDLAVVALALAVAWALLEYGFRWLIARDRAARARLVADRIAADRETARHGLPPGVTLTEAWEAAARGGVSLADGAEQVYLERVRVRFAGVLTSPLSIDRNRGEHR